MYNDIEIPYDDGYSDQEPIKISAELQQFTEDLIVNLGLDYFPDEVEPDALDGICLNWYSGKIWISASIFKKEQFSIFVAAETGIFGQDFDSFFLKDDFVNKLKIILYNYLGE